MVTWPADGAALPTWGVALRQLSSEHEGPWHCMVPPCRADTEPPSLSTAQLSHSAGLAGLAGSGINAWEGEAALCGPQTGPGTAKLEVCQAAENMGGGWGWALSSLPSKCR